MFSNNCGPSGKFSVSHLKKQYKPRIAFFITNEWKPFRKNHGHPFESFNCQFDA